MRDPKSILITGASSGIGEALALSYAAPGVTLALGGRSQERIDSIAERSRAKGADAHTAVVDVTDREACRSWIEQSDQRAALDLVIANAGISAGTGGGGEHEHQTRAVFATNVDGVINTVLPVVPLMRGRGRGQIAIMSSLAGFRGLPGAPAYSSSKTAVRAWGEALRGSLHAHGIEVSVICPGYVRTPMTDANDFPMPLLMDADRAVRIIRRGLERNRGRIAFPFAMYALVRLMAGLPTALIDPVLRRLPEKGADH